MDLLERVKFWLWEATKLLSLVVAVSLLVSKIGNGRAVMFADNPNFRGSWYGTNRLFLNAILLGDKIRVP